MGLLTILLLSSLFCMAQAGSPQFHNFFPAWSGTIKAIIRENCSTEFAEYQNRTLPDRRGAGSAIFMLANCILDEFPEFQKMEMGIVAVLFGLLPTFLQAIGPSTTETSLLAQRRPILTFLLCLGSPSVYSGHRRFGVDLRTPKIKDNAGGSPGAGEPLLKSEPDIVSEKLLPSFLVEPSTAVKAAISICEYLIAMTAAANIIFLAYRLAFWAINIAAIAIWSLYDETYSPFVWVFLVLPVHLFGLLTLRVCTQPTAHEKSSWISGGNSKLQRFFKDELTPCAFGRPLELRRDKRKTRLLLVLTVATSLLTWCHILYATVSLSSQIFISLGDVIPIIARICASGVVCRGILVFELFGMNEVAGVTVL